MTPFYVDIDADSMCFIIHSDTVDIDTKLFPRMQFLENIPSSLKIEGGIYDILENLQTVDALDMPMHADGIPTYEFVISPFPNMQVSSTDSDTIALNWGNEVINKLLSYRLDDLSSFYWKVAPTSTENIPQEELQRIEQWNGYVNTLEGGEVAGQDPCGVKDLSVSTMDVSVG